MMALGLLAIAKGPRGVAGLDSIPGPRDVAGLDSIPDGTVRPMTNASCLLRRGVGARRRCRLAGSASTLQVDSTAGSNSASTLQVDSVARSNSFPGPRLSWKARRAATGFEAQDNHNTAVGCNADVLQWFNRTFLGTAEDRVDVLDVGGGKGSLGTLVGGVLQGRLAWDCIDVVPSTKCAGFNGLTIPRPAASKDTVIFNYVLHHAADNTISLLKEAVRVSRRYIIVAEDLAGGNRAEAARLVRHEWRGTFRGAAEWKMLFKLLGTELLLEASPSPGCAGPYIVPRGLYVLAVKRP